MTPLLERGGSGGPRRVDGAELARFRDDPSDAAVALRFARHVLSRYPEDVWALSELAQHAREDADFEQQIRRAIKLGLIAIQARMTEGSIVFVRQDTAAEATLMAMLLYGSFLARRGRESEAQKVLETMLDLDESDTVGAVAVLENRGVRTNRGMSLN